MIISKIMLAVCIIGVIVNTFVGIYVMISDQIKAKKHSTKKQHIMCIHTKSDCEECISQAGCHCKEENIIKVGKEQ